MALVRFVGAIHRFPDVEAKAITVW